MFEDKNKYITPSVTVLGQNEFSDPVTSSGDVDWGVGDNTFFPED